MSTLTLNPKPLFLGITLTVAIVSGYTYIAGLKTPPSGVDVLGRNSLKHLTGPWFELARLDNDLQRGRNPMLLAYPDSDQTLKILMTDTNEGRFERIAQWSGHPDTASFTMPCWRWIVCGYHVIAEDTRKHQWMMVSGHNRQQLWIFARVPGLPDEQFSNIKEQARSLGYDVDALVIHNYPAPVPKDLPPLPVVRPDIPKGAQPPVMSGSDPKPAEVKPQNSQPTDMLPMSEPPPMPMEGPPPMPEEGPPPMPTGGPPPMPSVGPPPMPDGVPEPMGPIYGNPDSEPANPEQR